MEKSDEIRLSTGISGLDEIMNGGFILQSTNLVRGGPGVGKTTFGLHFLMDGVMNNETSLFITLGEPVEKIKINASKFGFDTTKIQFLDLSPSSTFFAEVESYDIFTPAEVEREPTTKKIIETVEKLKPKRIFLDAMTQFKFLSIDNFQFHKQSLSFLHYLQEQGATVLFTTESSLLAPDDDLQFISDSVINLEKKTDGQFVQVSKFRGSDYISGQQTYKISNSGISIFPKLIPKTDSNQYKFERFEFGVPEIDSLLHGGISSSTINLISGPSGVGKTTLSMQLACNAAIKGHNTIIYSFEEEIEMILQRCENVKISARKIFDNSTLSIEKIEPLLYSADEFAQIVRNHCIAKKISIVILDSISGYKLALRGDDLIAKIHALCKYLQSSGVTVILINEIENITGDFKVTDVGISYLCDNIIFLRYLEVKGEMKKAIGVLKMRLNDFEKSLREFKITQNGVQVGEPLTNLRNILSGLTDTIIE